MPKTESVTTKLEQAARSIRYETDLMKPQATKSYAHTFSIMQSCMEVASGSGSMKDCIKEAAHYAMMYRQDGPVKVYIDGNEVKDE